jgi:hypothetical protein
MGTSVVMALVPGQAFWAKEQALFMDIKSVSLSEVNHQNGSSRNKTKQNIDYPNELHRYANATLSCETQKLSQATQNTKTIEPC